MPHGTEYSIAHEAQGEGGRLLTLPAAAFDALVDGVALFDRAGRPMLSNGAMRAALRSSAISREVGAMRDLLLQRAWLRTALGAREIAAHSVVVGTHSYLLHGVRICSDDISGPGFCITLHEGARVLPDEAALRERFHFTPCEARVALRIAEGRSNKDIAAALQVSLHTVRHHAEHVFDKMAVASRAGVAWKLLHE
jgi:DNA-binding CsgD family transcriptional regulator